MKFLGIFFGIILSVSGCTRSAPEQKAGLRKAPEIELEDSKGKRQAVLKGLGGRPVVVHFWATWCPPCLEELPRFLQMARELGGEKGPGFVAISLDKTWEQAEKALPRSSVPAGLISLIDPQQKSAEDFGSFQFPESYLLNGRGEIVQKWVGSQDWGNPELRARIQGAR